jgi:hypothetical protein
MKRLIGLIAVAVTLPICSPAALAHSWERDGTVNCGGGQTGWYLSYKTYGSYGGVFWATQLACTAQTVLHMGGQLWDDTQHSCWDAYPAQPTCQSGYTDSNKGGAWSYCVLYWCTSQDTNDTWLSVGLKCVSGDQYAIWTYGTENGTYHQFKSTDQSLC